MSRPRLSRSNDLSRLRDEGFTVSISAEGTHLVVDDVPYVTPQREVREDGRLIAVLKLSGDVTAPQPEHDLWFEGERPCMRDGTPFGFIIETGARSLTQTVSATYRFSLRPEGGGEYDDHYQQVTTYVALLMAHARAIKPGVDAQRHRVVPPEPEDDSVFRYVDTASSRARISLISDKLRLGKIAIVGLGGTGSYILDSVAKTPVREIHLFDGDDFLQHNAFRAPGAPSITELEARSKKVDYLFGIYDRMRIGIEPHPYHLTAENADELAGFDFAFVAIDAGSTKRGLIHKLEELELPFIDVGMGIYEVDGSLDGILRTTTSTPAMRAHVWQKNRIPFHDEEAVGEYDQNIQIAELNALNAALAVVRWKKHVGFYTDLEHEHFSAYTIDGNHVVNEDSP